jgi:glycosyltransferase involved in cell wall biosynthesis
MSGREPIPNRIKVALVISNLSYGGAERQVLELANTIDSQSFDLHLFILSKHAPLADQLRDHESRLHIVAKRHKFDITVINRLAAAFKALDIQVVHGFLFDAEIASRIAARLAGCPANIGSERNISNRNGFVKRLIYRVTSRLLDACIANSTAGTAFNHRVTGLAESRYHVVYNGVDTERFKPRDDCELRHELSLRRDQVVIGMFGSFKHQKNHPLLLQAAKLVTTQRPNVRFVFIGSTLQEGYKNTGTYKKEVIQLVEDLQLNEFCLFLGTKTDVERYYNLCDVTVLPSLFEGTPNVALESMASGVPVIATDVSDNHYVIPDGVAGYIVPLGNPEILAQKIIKLVDDERLRNRLGEQARNWAVNTFSLNQMSENVGAVYRQVLATKSKHRNR